MSSVPGILLYNKCDDTVSMFSLYCGAILFQMSLLFDCLTLV